jgi:aspartate carbamoyltransferase catalytic subunit
MRQHLGSLSGRKVVIVGDILHSRVARSNTWSLLAEGAHVVLCGPATLLPQTLATTTDEGRVEVTTDFDTAINAADAVMALRMQKERQETGLGPSLREYIRGYQLDKARLLRAKPGALVMHPGPMNEGIEISPEVAHGLTSVIEQQVANGVAVRMAILYLMATARRAR